MRAFAIGLSLLACAWSTGANAKTYKVDPGPQAQAQADAAFLAAKAKDQIQFSRGRFELTSALNSAAAQVTVRGAGADRTILSFTGQTAPGDCVTLSGGQIVLREFAVENCKGDAIKAKGGDQVTLLALRAEWTGAKPPKASGVATSAAKNVLIENVIVRGAPYAGIRVSEGANAVVRDSVVADSTIGIAIENTTGADVFKNSVTHNAAGIAVNDLPGAAQAGGRWTRVFDNQIIANDRAPASPVPGLVLGGVGVLLTATSDVAITENEFADNSGANVVIAAYRAGITDTKFNALARNVSIRKNRFGRTGFAPQGDLDALVKAGGKLGDIVWDGADTYFSGASHQSPVLLAIEDNKGLTAAGPGFVNLGLLTAGMDWTEAQPTTRLAPVSNVPDVPEVKLPRGM
jgi:parallel beta-helix repeat protein